MAAFSSGMPSVSVYLVLPSAIARTAAALTLSGVSKSGSPASSEMMSRPAARRARALAAAPVVAEGLTRRRLADSENIGADSSEEGERRSLRPAWRRRNDGKLDDQLSVIVI